jgi:hypothetical protein
MKKYSWNLFPQPLVILGYILIFLGLGEMLFVIISGKLKSEYFTGSAALLIIGAVMISFISSIKVGTGSTFIYKESSVLGLKLSNERIRIPGNCDKILIIEKQKRGTGYYRFVLPLNYSFKSSDMYFHSDNCMVKLINTDHSRALRIAEFIKMNLKIEYSLV